MRPNCVSDTKAHHLLAPAEADHRAQVTITKEVHTMMGAATPEDYAAKMWTVNTEFAMAPLRSVLSEEQVSGCGSPTIP